MDLKMRGIGSINRAVTTIEAETIEVDKGRKIPMEELIYLINAAARQLQTWANNCE